METEKIQRVRQNKTDTRKENITTTKACVRETRLFVQQERQSVFDAGPVFVDSWWQQFCVGAESFGKKRGARRAPNKHDEDAERFRLPFFRYKDR